MESIDINNLRRGLYLNERLYIKGENNIRDTLLLSRWMEEIFLQDKYLEHYLKTYRLNEEELSNLLSQRQEDILFKEEETPLWIRHINDIINLFGDDVEVNEYMTNKKYLKHPFSCFTTPFIKWILTKVTIEESVNYSEELIKEIIAEKTFEIVIEKSLKTLILELNYFSRNNKLKGDSPKDRYLDFCGKFKNAQYLKELIYKFPILFRVIVEELIKSKDYIIESLDNLNRDYKYLKKIFQIEGKIKRIEDNKGDSHCGKKSVLIFYFEKGSVVYKPRSLEIDKKFNAILNYINEKKLRYKLERMTYLVREEYGWQECIEAKECNSEDDLEKIYYKLGVYSCLFHILNTSDLHMDNLIISRDNPFFVDLESIFQSFSGYMSKEDNSFEIICRKIKNSIFETGLFPASIDKNMDLDISGITGKGGQTVLKGKCQIQDNYTDNMRLIRTDCTIKYKENIPKLNGKYIDPREYVSFIIEGFESCYDLIMKNKADFIDKDGLLTNFSNCKVRTILRDTQSYSVVLKTSTHPKYLFDGIYRNKLFDKMWAIVKKDKRFLNIVTSEIRDMMEGDIPYFYSYVNSGIVYDSLGRKCIENEYNMLEKSISRIRGMNEIAKKEQVKYIETSLRKPIKRWEIREYKKNYMNTNNLLLETDKLFIEEAEKIGNKILEQGILSDKCNDINWLNIDIGNGGQWIYSPQDAYLYSGVLGNGLFFTILYDITKNNTYKDVIEKILKSAEYLTKDIDENNISAFLGKASLAYCYYFMGLKFNRNDLIEKAIYYILSCKNYIENDKNFDIVSGCAGTLIVALNIFNKYNNKEILDVAINSGEHLIKYCIEKDNSIGWPTPAGGGQILSGMSHGSAGIAWALIELYKVVKDERYLCLASKAINFERKIYNREQNNWINTKNKKDLIQNGFTDPVNWCHGAPGLGISRIKCYDIFKDDSIIEEIQDSINKTLKEGFGGSDCLCHGTMGNIELLIMANKLFYKENYLLKARRIVSNLIKDANIDQWHCGIPQNFQVTSFMTGLSGIGYQLLRLTKPKLIPSVLTLELPEIN